MSRVAFVLLFAGLALLTIDPTGPGGAAAQEQKPGKRKGKKAAASKVVEPAPGGPSEDLSRVLPVFDPGSHTQPITAMGFTTDQSKLVTVGQDFTVQVWSPATGERLDILRLPGYGREKGYDPGRWDVAVVSPDGTRVAIGGQMKYLSAEGDDNSGRLLLVNVFDQTLFRVQLRTGRNRRVSALAFSPDGTALAIGIETGPKEAAILMLVGDLAGRIQRAHPGLVTTDCHQIELPATPTEIAWSPDGKRLVVGAKNNQKLTLWDVAAGPAPRPTLTKQLKPDADTMGIAWSADSKRFAHTIKRNDEANRVRVRGIDLRTADGELVKSWRAPELSPALTPKAFVTLFGVRFLDANTLYFVANGGSGEPAAGGGTIAGVLDMTSGVSRRIGIHPEGMVNVPVESASGDGKLVAYTVTSNTEVLIRPADGSTFVRCGQRSPIPYYLGWSKDPAKPGFAWTPERTRPLIAARTPADVKFGFDLGRVEPIGAIDGANYIAARWAADGWSLKPAGTGGRPLNDGFKGLMRLLHEGKPVAGLPGVNASARSLIPTAQGPPLVAVSNHMQYLGERAYVFQADGVMKTRLLPDFSSVTDLVTSPDGRFLAATTGTPRIVVYRTDGSSYPLLSFATLNGEWVCWTPEGYYAASPGGEKLFGWAVNNGPNSLVTFHPAAAYASTFRRPDVIRLAIEKGSVKEALASLHTVAPAVETILPPAARVELIEQRGANVKVKATAASGAKDKPIVAMRVLFDGRPLPGGNGVWTPAPGTPEAVFEFEVPAGAHEVKVLARTADGAAVSDPLVVRGPTSPDHQPTVHRVCVGVNEYADSGLRLAAAAKDARDIYDAVQKYCVGPNNRFGTARGELLLDADATRDRVLAALRAARTAAKPGDLVVFYFAGHGVKQGDTYYLLTQEARSGEDLKGKALSGDDLRAVLAEIECPVLLVLDACHSAAATRTLRPATDDLTRSLTDDTVGVTVLAAAMAHEVAGATAENGYFTAGLLKGLAAGAGVPFDPYEKQLYVHHLYAVAYSEVRRATGGKQNPFLNMPWTVPPLAVREVPAR